MFDFIECAAWGLMAIAGWYGIYLFFKAVGRAFDAQKAEYEREARNGW